MGVLNSMNLTSRMISAVFVFAACSLGVLAQENPQKVRFAIVKVKPDMVGEFRDVLAEVTAAYKKAGVPWRHVWEPAGFGDSTKWLTVVPMLKKSDWGLPPFVSAMGEAGFQQYAAKASKCYTNIEYTVELSRPEISIQSGTIPPFIQFATVTVALGKEGAWESKQKTEALPALKKAGYKEVWVTRNMYGGESTSTYSLATGISSLGDLEEGSALQRAMGPEAYQRFRESLTGIVTSVKYETFKYVPELSYAESK